jgi:hypothetical protein
MTSSDGLKSFAEFLTALESALRSRLGIGSAKRSGRFTIIRLGQDVLLYPLGGKMLRLRWQPSCFSAILLESSRSPIVSSFQPAQSKEQAGVIFALAAKIVRMSEPLSKAIIIRDHTKELYCPARGTLVSGIERGR